ncbi:MAG: cell division protein FtsA [Verrucomicrobiia bacterium]
MFLKRNEPDILVALEVGTHKIVAAVAETTPTRELNVLGLGEELSAGVRKGEIVDFKAASDAIQSALVKAEEITDVQIAEVYLALSGGHIGSRNLHLRTAISDDDQTIREEHLADLAQMAAAQPIPPDHVRIHELPQHYYLDNETPVDHPLGLSSSSLGASYHVIHGMETRLETTVRSIRELGIMVKGCAVSAYAGAQAVLSEAQKMAGAVLIDLGAGTSDYIVYSKGAVIHSGVLGVGGDHLTQDLSIGLKIPYARAERLKVDQGHLDMDGFPADDRILLPRDGTFDEKSIARESMSLIMRVRQEETLRLISDDLDRAGVWPLVHGGVFLTGGASRTRGLLPLASQIFPAPVQIVSGPRTEGDDRLIGGRPDLITVLGLLRYAQTIELREGKPRGWARLRHSLRSVLESIRLV